MNFWVRKPLICITLSFDLILCANVLHNSRNIHDVMENLKGLLTDNGSMVILEETRTSYILLTSMEFKDGLTGLLLRHCVILAVNLKM